MGLSGAGLWIHRGINSEARVPACLAGSHRFNSGIPRHFSTRGEHVPREVPLSLARPDEHEAGVIPFNMNEQGAEKALI